MMITLSKTLLAEVQKHAELTFPEECCGGLLGKYDASSDNRIVKTINRIDNLSEENKARRFMITPKDYLKIEKIAKEQKLELLGFYHSHPDHPAKPSETDLNYAWPNFSYPIVSVLSGKLDVVRSYTLVVGKREFVEEEVVIED